jgi:hypothetical protein
LESGSSRSGLPIVLSHGVEHVNDLASSWSTRRVRCVRRNIEDVTWVEYIQDTFHRELECARDDCRPLLMRVGVLGQCGAGVDVNTALGHARRVDIPAMKTRGDLAWC